jgi:hypothetical protein
VGLCSAGLGGPGVSLVGMSGRVPPLAMEAVPSRVATTSLLLAFEILLRLAGLDSLATVRRPLWF